MADQRETIRDLIVAHLRDAGMLDPGEVVVHWVALVGLHGADDDGPVNSTVAINGSDGLPIYVELGLLEQRRMVLHALLTDAIGGHPRPE